MFLMNLVGAGGLDGVTPGGLSATPIATGITPYWHFTGAFHPAVAHFPIALLMVAALVESWSVFRRQRKPLATTQVCLYLGTAAAVVATLLGWANADASGEASPTVSVHRWLGVAVAVLAVVSTALSLMLSWPRPLPGVVWIYRGGLMATAAMVGLVGSYGGKIVHGESYYDDAYATLQSELGNGAAKVAKGAAGEVAQVADSAKSAVRAAAKVIESAPTLLTTPPTSPTPTSPTPTSPTPTSPTPTLPTPVNAGTPWTPNATRLPTPTPRPTLAAAADVPSPVESGTTRPAEATAAKTALASAPVAAGEVDYRRDVEPIFQANCVKCHNETKKKGGYRLDSRDKVLAAGESGTPAVLPGKSDQSLLVKVIEGKGDYADAVMPPKGNQLSYEQIAVIRQWIDEGARTSTP